MGSELALPLISDALGCWSAAFHVGYQLERDVLRCLELNKSINFRPCRLIGEQVFCASGDGTGGNSCKLREIAFLVSSMVT